MANDEANYLIERLKVLCADMTELLNQTTEELGRIGQADTPQTDIPSRDELGDCNSCEYLGDLRCGMCTNGSGYRRADTPQTQERSE